MTLDAEEILIEGECVFVIDDDTLPLELPDSVFDIFDVTDCMRVKVELGVKGDKRDEVADTVDVLDRIEDFEFVADPVEVLDCVIE